MMSTPGGVAAQIGRSEISLHGIHEELINNVIEP
jgi:hypothetical protein